MPYDVQRTTAVGKSYVRIRKRKVKNINDATHNTVSNRPRREKYRQMQRSSCGRSDGWLRQRPSWAVRAQNNKGVREENAACADCCTNNSRKYEQYAEHNFVRKFKEHYFLHIEDKKFFTFSDGVVYKACEKRSTKRYQSVRIIKYVWL